MDKLPPEVLISTFIHVPFRSRIRCALVCKSWWRILNECSMFHNIDIQNSEFFTKFMDRIKRSPHRAAQVHEFSLTNVLLSDFNKRILVDVFPNARVLKMIDEWEPWTTIAKCKYFSKPIELTHSKSNIRVLHDSVHCEMASQLFTSNLCGKLEELKLTLEDSINESAHFVMNQLNDLPFLKRLYLENAQLGIRDLERIRKHAPVIQELRLSYSEISQTELPSYVISASSVTTLAIHIYDVDNTQTLC
jgi:hypothetical protein